MGAGDGEDGLNGLVGVFGVRFEASGGGEGERDRLGVFDGEFVPPNRDFAAFGFGIKQGGEVHSLPFGFVAGNGFRGAAVVGIDVGRSLAGELDRGGAGGGGFGAERAGESGGEVELIGAVGGAADDD